MSTINTKTITTSELRRLRSGNTDMLLLDVLTKEQFGKDHIEGAKNVPFGNAEFLPAVARAAGSKSKKIVVYCTGETCKSSSNAAKALTDAGYTDVHAYEGGITEWRSNEKVDRKDGAKDVVKDDKKGSEAHHAAGASSTSSATTNPARHETDKGHKPADKPAHVNTGGSMGTVADAHGKKEHKAGAP